MAYCRITINPTAWELALGLDAIHGGWAPPIAGFCVIPRSVYIPHEAFPETLWVLLIR